MTSNSLNSPSSEASVLQARDITLRFGGVTALAEAARLLAYRAFNLIDHGVRSEVQSAMAKWYATEMAVNVTSKALQIHGGNGITKDFGVELLFRNARMMPIPDGTTEIQKLIIGRALTGINAFS